MSKAGWKEVEEGTWGEVQTRNVNPSKGAEAPVAGGTWGQGQWLTGLASLVLLPTPDQVSPPSSLTALNIKLVCIPDYTVTLIFLIRWLNAFFWPT